MKLGFWLASALILVPSLSFGAPAADCPEGGVVRFGVEPFDTSAKLLPIYDEIGRRLTAKIGCEVKIFVASTYNAEIEAMRAGKLEIGQFGPLGYVLAHKIAKAEAIAAFANAAGEPDSYWASLVTYPGSGIQSVADLKGRSFAFSDPASTSGHLFPAYGLRKAGLDPDKDLKPVYAGSHTASFEALYNHKVDAGELNSEQLESATQRGHYKEGDLVFLWKSDAIPTDPMTVRGDLPPAFKQKLADALRSIDLSSLPEGDRKVIGAHGVSIVAQTDQAYDGIRDLVKILNIDLDKL
jgi:phosphonate transport system substrate-binding protein